MRQPDLFQIERRDWVSRLPATPATPAPIGSGPPDQTCRTCCHWITHMHHDKGYKKCDLATAMWIHGAGSDVKGFWPACREWEANRPG